MLIHKTTITFYFICFINEYVHHKTHTNAHLQNQSSKKIKALLKNFNAMFVPSMTSPYNEVKSQ